MLLQRCYLFLFLRHDCSSDPGRVALDRKHGCDLDLLLSFKMPMVQMLQQMSLNNLFETPRKGGFNTLLIKGMSDHHDKHHHEQHHQEGHADSHNHSQQERGQACNDCHGDSGETCSRCSCHPCCCQKHK